MRCFAYLIALSSVSIPYANAQNSQVLMGVHFVKQDWKEKEHTDTSYREFKKIQGDVKRGDFYYRFVVYPRYMVTFSNCNQEPTLGDFLRRFVGETQSSFLVVRTLVRHHNSEGDTSLADKLPIIIAGKGIIDNTGKEGNAASLIKR